MKLRLRSLRKTGQGFAQLANRPAGRANLWAMSATVRLEVLRPDIRDKRFVTTRLPEDDPRFILMPDGDRDQPHGMTLHGPERPAASQRRIWLRRYQVDYIPDCVHEVVIGLVLLKFIEDALSVWREPRYQLCLLSR